MLGSSHIIVGLGAWTVVAANYVPHGLDMPAYAIAAFGALLPDIDHPRSMISRQFKPFKLISKVLPHRGPTHSLIFIFALAALLTFAHNEWASPEHRHWLLALWVGASSHLVADWMTRGGIPLFWPTPGRYRMPGAFLTGSSTEKVITTLVIMAMIFYFSGWYTQISWDPIRDAWISIKDYAQHAIMGLYNA